jgi:hypothetical protein
MADTGPITELLADKQALLTQLPSAIVRSLQAVDGPDVV